MIRILRKTWAAAAALSTSFYASAQTAVVDYSTPVPVAAAPPPEVVPVIGQSGLLALGLLVALVGIYGLRKSAKASRIVSLLAITCGLAISASSGSWLANNAHAIPEVTEFLFSEHPAPVSVTSFPATLVNDLELPATIESIDVSDCPNGVTLAGNCAQDFVLAANGGSCTLESICTPIQEPPTDAQQCDGGTDTISGDAWTVCEASAESAWVSHALTGGGSYRADLICQELGYDRVDQYGGTCGDVCGYCQTEVTSCESPGNKTFDSSGGVGFPTLAVSVMWTCVNDPE